MSYQNDKELIHKILEFVTEHGQKSGKVMRSFRIYWNRAGDNLTVNGYAIEYKELPKPKANV